MPVRRLLAALLSALLLLFVASSANAYDRQLPNGDSTVATDQGQTLVVDRSTNLATVRLQRFTRRNGSLWRPAIVRPRRGPVRSCLTMTAVLRVRATQGDRIVGYRSDKAKASDCDVAARVQGVARLEANLRQVTPGRLRRNAEHKLQRMVDSLHLEGRVIISDPPPPPAPVDDDPYQLLPYYPDPVAPDGPTICPPQDGKVPSDCDPRPRIVIYPPSAISLENPDSVVFLETQKAALKPKLPHVSIIFLVHKVEVELSSPLLQIGLPRQADVRWDGTPCPEGTVCWVLPVRGVALGRVTIMGLVATLSGDYATSMRSYDVEICATSAECSTVK